MGLAVDTIGFTKTNPGAGPSAATANPGDTFTVRNFAPTATAKLLQVTRSGATKGFVQVRSPVFHDDVRGIRLTTSQANAAYLASQYAAEALVSQDTLIVELSGGAAETDGGTLLIGYSDCAGIAARLHSWGDIANNIKHIKPLTVAFTTSATIGTWVDTVITTTEDLLHANTDYAVLGIETDTAVAALGIRGQETGNLRYAVSMITDTYETGDQFVELANNHNMPLIPVINAANKGSIFLSAFDIAASTAGNGVLVLAEMIQNLPS
jgi:hypothetical protein